MTMFTAEDLIDSYTREQAIEDGVLVDVSEIAREAVIKYPTALTRAVGCEVVEPDDKAKEHGESEQGRLWDVLYMFSVAAKRNGGTELLYKLIATREGKQHTRELKAVCGHGDTIDPVITIMLPNED